MEENSLDVRKLIKFGNSSFVVSLPSEWIKKNKLVKGDLVRLSKGLNNELVLGISSKERGYNKKEITINTENKDLNILKREIVSSYLNNYSIIRIKCKPSYKNVEEIKKIVQNLMALEIVEQTSDTIVTKDFLDMSEITFIEILRKIDNITRSMLEDLKYAQSINYSKNILSRDEEVNRMAYLMIRIMRFTLHNPNLVHKDNILSIDNILNIWDITLTIESIADDIKRTSREFNKIKISTDQFKKLLVLLGDIEKFYWESMKSYYTNDTELAYKLSNNKTILSTRCNELHEVFWNKKYVPIILENFKNIISSIHNVGRRVYS